MVPCLAHVRCTDYIEQLHAIALVPQLLRLYCPYGSAAVCHLCDIALLRLFGVNGQLAHEDSDKLCDALFASFVSLGSLLAFDLGFASFLLWRKLLLFLLVRNGPVCIGALCIRSDLLRCLVCLFFFRLLQRNVRLDACNPII